MGFVTSLKFSERDSDIEYGLETEWLSKVVVTLICICLIPSISLTTLSVLDSANEPGLDGVVRIKRGTALQQEGESLIDTPCKSVSAPGVVTAENHIVTL